MAAPFMNQWSPATKVAVHEGFVSFLDGGSGNARVTIHRSDDVLLATLLLERPCGTVNPSTGQITMIPGPPEDNAPAGGTASYAVIRDSTGEPHRSLGCIQGSVPVINICVINNIEIDENGRVALLSMVIS